MFGLRRVPIIVAVLVALCTWSAPNLVWATPASQEGNSIQYGETATGEITNKAFEQLWSFEGSAGDIVALTVRCDAFSGYVFLEDGDGEIIAEIDAFTAFDLPDVGLFYIAKLPAAGTYTIIITRQGGRTGSGEGSYELKLEKLALLPWETPISLSVEPEEQALVYTVFEADAPQTVQLDYKVVFGDLRPQLTVGFFEDSEWGAMKMQRLLVAFGSNLKTATFAVDVPSAGTYMVGIGKVFGESAQQEMGVFEITVSPAQ